jgi:hypothetical protein
VPVPALATSDCCAFAATTNDKHNVLAAAHRMNRFMEAPLAVLKWTNGRNSGLSFVTSQQVIIESGRGFVPGGVRLAAFSRWCSCTTAGAGVTFGGGPVKVRGSTGRGISGMPPGEVFLCPLKPRDRHTCRSTHAGPLSAWRGVLMRPTYCSTGWTKNSPSVLAQGGVFP